MGAHKPSVKLYGEAFFEEYFTEEQVATLRVPNPYGILWRANIFRKLGMGFAAFDMAMRPYIGLLDGCLDFGYQAIVQDYATSPLPWVLRRILASFRLAFHNFLFPSSFTLLRYADNHDMNRLAHVCKNEDRYIEAQNLLFTCSGRHPVVI